MANRRSGQEKGSCGMKRGVKMPATRNLFAICVPILIILAALGHLAFSGNVEPPSALAAPPRVIHARRAPDNGTVRNVDGDDCDRVNAEDFDPAPGWPHTA